MKIFEGVNKSVVQKLINSLIENISLNKVAKESSDGMDKEVDKDKIQINHLIELTKDMYGSKNGDILIQYTNIANVKILWLFIRKQQKYSAQIKLKLSIVLKKK